MRLSSEEIEILTGVRPRLAGPAPAPAGRERAHRAGEAPAAFGAELAAAVRAVRAAQEQAAGAAAGFARGEGELHRVLVAVQQAQLTLELAAAVRNKVVEAYQELSRMPF